MRIERAYEIRGMLEKISSYDAATSGNVVNEVKLVYNDFGQLTTDYQQHDAAVNTGTSPKVQYSYTNGSSGHIRRTKITYPNGRELNFYYGTSGGTGDAMNRVESLKDNDGSTELAKYTYLGLADFVKVDYTEPDLRMDFDHGTAGEYAGLDAFDRVIDLKWRDYGAGADAVRIHHGYDRASNRLYREDDVAETNGVHVDELYSYDGIYRLLSMMRGDLTDSKNSFESGTINRLQTWDLDPTGNWTEFKDADDTSAWDLVQQRTHNKVNEITEIAATTGTDWADPDHDRAGNMTEIPKPDALDERYGATYDVWNRLVKLEDLGAEGSSSSSGSSPVVAEYEYDGRNFRTVKKIYDAGQLDETRHFYYTSGWQCLEERVDSSTDPDRQYIWGHRYIDDLILRDRDADTASSNALEERRYALQDPNYNVVAIADETGDIQERYIYDPYGKPTTLTPAFGSRDSSNYAWDYLFTTRRRDEETGLYYYRARYCDTGLGRFIMRDPIGYAGKDFNLYRYCGNNPVIFVDPSGMYFPPPGGWPPIWPPPKPTPGTGGANAKGLGGMGYLWTCGCSSKKDRLTPIPGVKTPPTSPIPGTGPAGGNYQTHPFPGTPPAAVGGGGAGPCNILVVKCPGFVTVFHFSVGDSPDRTLAKFTWPQGCEAIMCGGDDSDQSNCLGDAVKAAARFAGLPVVGVSGNSGCGVDANGNWYQHGN